MKIPLSPAAVVPLVTGLAAIRTARAHVSAGGNVGFVSLAADQITAFDRLLQANRLSGLTLRGNGSLWLGHLQQSKVSAGVKQALDPDNRYPALYH